MILYTCNVALTFYVLPTYVHTYKYIGNVNSAITNHRVITYRQLLHKIRLRTIDDDDTYFAHNFM